MRFKTGQRVISEYDGHKLTGTVTFDNGVDLQIIITNIHEKECWGPKVGYKWYLYRDKTKPEETKPENFIFEDLNGRKMETKITKK